MHAYLATVCRDCACEAYRVGGVADHVHIAARLARTISQSELLEKIKKTSSAWIKTQGPEYVSFFWQGGYGAFSNRLQSVRRSCALYRGPGGAPQDQNFSGGIPRIVAEVQCSIRRTVCVGLRTRIGLDYEARFQRFIHWRCDEPRPLAWAGMKQTFGLMNPGRWPGLI